MAKVISENDPMVVEVTEFIARSENWSWKCGKLLSRPKYTKIR